MDLTQIRVFLVLAEELHFGRAADRLGLSQPRVSRLTAALEREGGGALFDRTTRRVRLTPLGTRLRDGWQPAYRQLQATLDDVRTAARRPEGTLRVGFTLTTGGTAVTRLIRAFTEAHPGCDVRLQETGLPDVCAPLRRDEIDVLVSLLAASGPGLTAGPAIEHRARALAVSRDHPLTRRGRRPRRTWPTTRRPSPRPAPSTMPSSRPGNRPAGPSAVPGPSAACPDGRTSSCPRKSST